MIALSLTQLDELREHYRHTTSPSGVLREMVRVLPGDHRHKVDLIGGMRAAFGLSLQQASPIAGWAPDGSGELKDAQLDSFLRPAIESNRDVWDIRANVA